MFVTLRFDHIGLLKARRHVHWTASFWPILLIPGILFVHFLFWVSEVFSLNVKKALLFICDGQINSVNNCTGLWQRAVQQMGLSNPCPDGSHETTECEMPNVPEMRHDFLLLQCQEQTCRQRTSGACQRTREVGTKSLHHMWPPGTYF